MFQTPQILTFLLSPFLEVWAILLLVVQQLIYSLSIIFGRRKKLQRNTGKPDKWTHKTALRGFRWLQCVALLSSFHILGRKIGEMKMKYGKGWIHKVLSLLLVLYSPSLPHQAECPSGSFCQTGRSICLGCVHADRQPCSCWSSVTTYAAISQTGHLPARATQGPAHAKTKREASLLPQTFHPRPPWLHHHHSSLFVKPLHRVGLNAWHQRCCGSVLWCRASVSLPVPGTLCFALSSTKSCFIFLCGGLCHALKEPENDYTDEWWNMSSCSHVPLKQKGRR